MSINYPVPPGTIVLCDYDTGFRPPEMVKRRPVVVVSPRLKGRDSLCTVVPLSTTPPPKAVPYVCRIELPQALSEKFSSTVLWVKADMLATVAYRRLDLFRSKRDEKDHRRRYYTVRLTKQQMQDIRACILIALGIVGHITD